MTDVHSSPDPSDDPDRSRAMAWLLGGRGGWGTFLWFVLLAAALIALVLVANSCDDDDDEVSTASTPAATAVPADPTPTAVPEPTAAPEPTATPEPTPVPEPTAVPLTPMDVTWAFDAEQMILTGSVPDTDTRSEMVVAAATIVGPANVVDQLVIDDTFTTTDGTIRLVGQTDDGSAAAAAASAAGFSGSVVDDTELTIVQRTDIVAELNALFAANPVQFAVGSSEILPASEAVLQEVADKLQEFPAVNLLVKGHTDSQGNPASNLQLSQFRADSVRTDLVARGVELSRLTTLGVGDTEPIADNSTAEGRQQNRRIEFSIESS